MKRLAIILIVLGLLPLFYCLATSSLSLSNYASTLQWVGLGSVGLGCMAMSGNVDGRRIAVKQKMMFRLDDSREDLRDTDRAIRFTMLLLIAGVFALCIAFVMLKLLS